MVTHKIMFLFYIHIYIHTYIYIMSNHLQPTPEETALYNEVDELLKEACEIITELKSYKGKQ